MKLLLLFVSLTSFAQSYLPLATGNQWIFRSNRFGQTLSIEVGAPRVIDGAEYFAVTGFSHPNAVRWLSQADDGALVEYLEDQKRTRPFLALRTPVGVRFDANVDDCSRSATVTARDAKLSLAAAGDFSNIATVKYSDTTCADAGIDTDYFLPDVGLVKRVEITFAGPLTYELAYARINGFITLAQPETSFALSTPSPVREGSRIFARMTVRNGGPAPLKLSFASGQRFNLELTEAATGRVIYNWASDKSFIQLAETLSIDREKNWVVDFPTPEPLKAGSYILEAFLTTAESAQRYRARVLLEVLPLQ
jgi:hypothetical protein